MKKAKLNNKGYTLVEMIIVIAIIMVVSTMAVVTIGIIHSAKAKDSAVTFDSEISTLITKCKNMGVNYDADGDGTEEAHPEYNYALKVYLDGENYYIQHGYYDSSADDYIFDATTETMNGGLGMALSVYCEVTYTPVGGTTAPIDETGICIRFDKKGTCVEGYGTFGFNKKRGNNVANVLIRKNGSHEGK